MNTIISRAAVDAALWHADQVRKIGNEPYIKHPAEVARTLAHHGCDAEIQAAGWLHDVIEDTDADMDWLVTNYGMRIADMVATASEDKSITDWKTRKQDFIDRIRETENLDGLKVICADKISNVSSLGFAIEEHGLDFCMSKFNAGKDDQVWYLDKIVAIMQERLNNAMSTMLWGLVQELKQQFGGQQV